MCSSVSDPQVRVIPHSPFSVLNGGFERGCAALVQALQAQSYPVSFLNWADADDAYDLLHLFSESGNWYDIVHHTLGHRRYVVSAIAGVGKPTLTQQLKLAAMRAMLGVLRGGKTKLDRAAYVARNAAAMICLNTLERDFYIRKFSLNPARVHIVANGVPEHRYSATPQLFETAYGCKDYVLYVGNIVERKNPLLLAQILVKRGLSGVFIGSTLPFQAAYGAAFRAFVQAHSTQILWIENLHYTDPLLDSAYAGAAVYCLPSSLETQPLGAMEAMATGTRLILGDAAYAYQPPFEQAIRCIPGDAGSLEQALDTALKANPIYIGDTYRWSAIATQIAAVYRQAMHDEPL